MNILRRSTLFSYYRASLTSFILGGSLTRSYRRFQKLNKYHTGAFLLSLSLFSSSDNLDKKQRELIKEADELFNNTKYRDICKLLEAYKDSSDVELLWRLTRAQYNLAQENSTSAEEKKTLIYEGFKIITRSLAINDNHFANHKWMSIMLDARSTYDGIKSRITHLESVKRHMLRAIELNPSDATSLYMLGLWCYQMADMPWYQRKIASTIFAAPPTSTYEEALEYFLKAETIDPKFYSQNLLMLGKTYMKLNMNDEALKYLKMAAVHPPTNDDDRNANSEAQKLLKNLKV